jgi:hypothetical protein
MVAQRPPSYDVGVFNGQYRERKATYIRYAFPGGMMRVNDNGAFFLLQKFKFCCNYGPPCLHVPYQSGGFEEMRLISLEVRNGKDIPMNLFCFLGERSNKINCLEPSAGQVA